MTRAMIVVAAGSSRRYGGDKLAEVVAGRPLIAHTVSRVLGTVDHCVLVARPDRLGQLRALELGVEVVAGGTTRTLSEMAGLAAVGDTSDLIGIHDGARPLVTAALIDSVFAAAGEVGGAVPVVSPSGMMIDKRTIEPAAGLALAQTPQAFEAGGLLAAYVKAAQAGEEGTDTSAIVELHGDLEIAAVPGEERNLKVTRPEDMAMVRNCLEYPSGNGPR